jgi:CheY-like chemotaxis protein
VRRKLLLADDSVTIQRVVELTFSGEDIDVVTVSDGEQAIARIVADPPDIVLADIAMPKKNGYEVAAFIKEHPTLSRVPVLLLAGAFEPVDEERARKVKSDGVLVKPFETHEVITRVRELIDRERTPQRPPVPPPPVPEQPVQQQRPAQQPPAQQPSAPPTPAPVADVPPVVAAPPIVEAPAPRFADAPAPAPAAVSPPASASAPPPANDEESLDAYFDRLDVAFTQRAQNPPRPFPHLTPPSHEQPEPAPAASARETTLDAEPGNIIADLFKAFLEVEQGSRDAASIRIPDEIGRLRRSNTIE